LILRLVAEFKNSIIIIIDQIWVVNWNLLKIMVAPDSFKSSLTAKQAAGQMVAGIKDVMPNAQIYKFPIADGGEGTTECIVDAVGGQIIKKNVTGPLGDPVTGFYGILDDSRTAIIEVASASGLCLVPEEKFNPLRATSYGTGELITAAIDSGCREIFIGLGGSATIDAGAGILQALGARFLDCEDGEIGRGPAELTRLERIDLSTVDRRLLRTSIVLGYDVDNPLCGPMGASAVYGPQKGATPEMIKEIELALQRFVEVAGLMGKHLSGIPGAGAAGGIAAGLSLVGATAAPGLDKILEITGIEKVLQGGIHLLLTGEGEFNFQSFRGKAPVGVARLAKKYNIPTVVLTGNIGEGVEQAPEEGIESIACIVPRPMELAEALGHAPEYLRAATARVIKLIELGYGLRDNRAGSSAGV
jgi:glycerate kinase